MQRKNTVEDGTLDFAFNESAAAARERCSCKASATRFSCRAESRGLRTIVSATSFGSDMCRTGVIFRRGGAESGRWVTGAGLGRSAAAASALFCASRVAFCCLQILTCSRTRSRSSATATAVESALLFEVAIGAGAVDGRAIVWSISYKHKSHH
jgi:hypothetical protein